MAKAALYLVEHPRREMYLGWPTVKAIVGNKIFPGYIDRYLARTNYDAQQSNLPADPNRPNNLFKPMDDAQDHGAYGRCDARAHTVSPLFWVDSHRGWVAAGLALMGGWLLSRR